MPILLKFVKLMKSELRVSKKKSKSRNWIIDESKYLNADEINKLRNEIRKQKEKGLKKNKFTPVRNWFMIELGLNAGLRVEEMASLKHDNILINERRSSILVHGKGNKKRLVWINQKFKSICQEYINYKKIFGFSIGSDAYLLNNLKNAKITKRSLQKFFKSLVEKAELARNYSIHSLRHTYATFLLKASNNNYRFVQRQLGHASIRTTQVYAGIIESEGKRALEKLYS